MADVWLIGDRDTRHMTHRALDETVSRFPDAVTAKWVGTDSSEVRDSSRADAIWVVPGTPYRNEGNVHTAIGWARENRQPMLATCGGFQHVILEFSRNVLGLDVGHAETDPDHPSLVIEQLRCSLTGEVRSVYPVDGSRLAEICGPDEFPGFHWCNYGLSEEYVDDLARGGLEVSATSDDAGTEAVELRDHLFFMATLFQPQVGASVDGRLHPVVDAFVSTIG